MSSQHICECNATFVTEQLLLRHKASSCYLTHHKDQHECEFCNKTYTRKDALLRHLNTCKQAKLARQSNQSSIEDTHTHIHNTTDNSDNQQNIKIVDQSDHNHHNHTQSHNQTIVNHNNNYNITYTADLSSRNMLEQMMFFLKDYINKGEEGMKDFYFERILTDPKDVNKLAIDCINYNQQKFVYSIKDDENQTPVLQEDTKLMHLEETHLRGYNKYIKEIVIKNADKLVNCKGKNATETTKNVQKLLEAMLTRKKLPLLMARTIRSKREGSSIKIANTEDKKTKEETRDELWEELKKDVSLLESQTTPDLPKQESVDDEIGRKSFYIHTTPKLVTQEAKKIEALDKEDLKYLQWNQKAIEKDKELARRLKEERERKEKENNEIRELKEKLYRATQIAKQQAQKEKFEKKKNKLVNKIIKQTGSIPVTPLETIEE